MPTLKQMVKQMINIEKQGNGEPGAYPVIFKNDGERIKFILLLRFERFKIKVKKLCHL